MLQLEHIWAPFDVQPAPDTALPFPQLQTGLVWGDMRRRSGKNKVVVMVVWGRHGDVKRFVGRLISAGPPTMARVQEVKGIDADRLR